MPDPRLNPHVTLGQHQAIKAIQDTYNGALLRFLRPTELPDDEKGALLLTLIDADQCDGDISINEHGQIAVTYDPWGAVESFFEAHPGTFEDTSDPDDEDDYSEPTWEVRE